MCLEILQEAVGTGHGAVQIVVKLSVGKQLAHRTLGVLQLLQHSIGMIHRSVHAIQSSLQVNGIEVVGKGDDVLARLRIGLRQFGHVGLQQAIELPAALVETSRKRLRVAQNLLQVAVAGQCVERLKQGIQACQHRLGLGQECRRAFHQSVRIASHKGVARMEE